MLAALPRNTATSEGRRSRRGQRHSGAAVSIRETLHCLPFEINYSFHHSSSGRGGKIFSPFLVMHKAVSLERQRQKKGYKSSDDEHGVEDVVLEGEQGQTHVGEDEVLRQEVEQFKELQHNRE